MKKSALLLFVIFSCWCLLAYADPDMKSYHATYQVQAHGFAVGTITRELQFNPPKYSLRIQSHSQLPLLALNGTETSEGFWENGHPIPLSYRYDYDYRGKNKQRTLTFNWKTKTAILDTPLHKIALPPRAQDKLSYQLALRHDLQIGGATLRYPIVDNKKIKTYQFTVIDSVSLHTALGTLETILVERKSKARLTQLWLAPSLDFMIVQAKYYNNGTLEACAEIEHLKFL
jgi:hypothetical protein